MCPRRQRGEVWRSQWVIRVVRTPRSERTAIRMVGGMTEFAVADVASFQFPSSPWTFRRTGNWELETGNFKPTTTDRRAERSAECGRRC
jgi:hypothetical protein